VTTDAGPAFLKAITASEGPHLLVAEVIGTSLAHWLGLPTFDWSILSVAEEDDLVLYNNSRPLPGPAFITREMAGQVWSGGVSEIQNLENPEDMVGLVILDTWLRNCDRFRPEPPRVNRNNVFLSAEDCRPGKSRLIAMDFTHIFQEGRPVSKKLGQIDQVKDARIYGLFPEWESRIRSLRAKAAPRFLKKMETWNEGMEQSILNKIPPEWDFTGAQQQIVAEFLS
jgi:hypothetical protein